jgi:hypothetical protein
VFLSWASIAFFAGARKEYRKQFRPARFVLFVCGWIVINMIVFVAVLASFGWFWLFPALFLEQFLFYMGAYWLFNIAEARAERVLGALANRLKCTPRFLCRLPGGVLSGMACYLNTSTILWLVPFLTIKMIAS